MMRYVSTINKSERITFYSTFFLIRTGGHITENHWIEKHIGFHFTHNAIFYSTWFLGFIGKIKTTPAPMLSILKLVP